MDRDLIKINSIGKLFGLIGKSEKSIELVYHYLLKNERIDDLKEVCEELEMSLKRGYKICSVLNELELVQIIDRPMKIFLLDPIPAWQKLINKRINDMKEDLEKRIDSLKYSMESFFKIYELKEPDIGEPIEFLNFDSRNFNWIFYQYLGKNVTKTAIGIVYENPLILELTGEDFSKFNEKLTDILKESFIELAQNIKNNEVYLILNSEVLNTFLGAEHYKKLLNHLKTRVTDIKPKKIDVRVTEEDFSNFSVRDEEMLIQPSFDPKNILLGSYISRQKDIIKIFIDKFEDLFENSTPINEYLEKNNIAGKNKLSEQEIMALGFLQ